MEDIAHDFVEVFGVLLGIKNSKMFVYNKGLFQFLNPELIVDYLWLVT